MNDVVEWFVYCNTTYYPWAEIVKATSAEEARSLANLMPDPVIVFPLSALALVTADDVLTELRDS